jgi:transposase
MEQVRVERLDHLGLMASVIKDIGLIDMIDGRLVPDEQERLTPGEAVAGMILNGLGFANRPLSLTPQFFANTPLDLLLREGIDATMLNRFKLGRTLEEASAYGCALLFEELACAICAHEGMDLRFHHLDTTSFALTGEYVPDSDAHAIHITHGSSKDHRPDLKQAVLELMVSQDGGVPFVSKSWDGNTSDTQVFQQRAEALMRAFKDTPTPRDLVADAKLSCEANAVHLAKLGFITRIPATLKVVSQVIGQALQGDTWQTFDDNTRYQPLALCHYGMAQRWLVVYSQAAFERAEATLKKAQQREDEAIKKQLFHLQAQRFCAPEAAPDALAALAKRWKYHGMVSSHLTEHKRYAGKGRPTPSTPLKASAWQIQVHVQADDKTIEQAKHAQACSILGTNIAPSELRDTEVITAYKGQSHVEGGFRFLKDPLFFVSSLFVKKPNRIEGLLMVMTLALLVYSVAQRRLRAQLDTHQETVPNQINQPTASPTLRWVFQVLEGIHRVRMTLQGQVHDLIEGLNDVQINILRLFGNEVCRLYQISTG